MTARTFHRISGFVAGLLTLLTSVVALHAQKDYHIWYFGYGAGVNFNPPTPTAPSDGVLNSNAGCATICDRLTGDLLFYSDGFRVWNRLP